MAGAAFRLVKSAIPRVAHTSPWVYATQVSSPRLATGCMAHSGAVRSCMSPTQREWQIFDLRQPAAAKHERMTMDGADFRLVKSAIPKGRCVAKTQRLRTISAPAASGVPGQKASAYVDFRGYAVSAQFSTRTCEMRRNSLRLLVTRMRFSDKACAAMSRS